MSLTVLQKFGTQKLQKGYKASLSVNKLISPLQLVSKYKYTNKQYNPNQLMVHYSTITL